MGDEIERVKKRGSIDALRARINSLKWEITNGAWSGIENGHFVRLGMAMDEVEMSIKAMRETLAALNELEPGHK